MIILLFYQCSYDWTIPSLESRTENQSEPQHPSIAATHPGNVSRMMGDSSVRFEEPPVTGTAATRTPTAPPRQATSTRIQYRANVTNLSYRVSQSQTQNAMLLVDPRANGGIAGDDMRVIDNTH